MRFLVGHSGEGTTAYIVDGDQAYDLSSKFPEVGADLSELARNPSLRERVRSATGLGDPTPVSAIVPALPIARPGTVICLGLNYVDHIKEGGYEIPKYPALFMRGTQSIMASGAPMVRPACSEQLDYEAELMLIIGVGGRHISEEAALNHVFGYTVFNDGSVRDYQRKTHQWTPGKNFDSTGAIGPFVVTPDELPAGAAGLNIRSRVGSEILQNSNTANMIWSAAKTIAVISEYTTLRPGDHIALGTPPGVGHAKEPGPRWLIPGETIEIEIEGIGVCANPVVDESDLTAAKAAE